MTDYTNIVNDLLSINDTMFAIGTSNKNIDKISIRMAFDKNWHNIAERAADAIEALQAEQKKTVTQIFGEEQQEWEEYCTGLMNRIRELKAQLPKRGEIVRCRECKHHEDEEPGMVYCPKIVGGWVDNDWFCADGERKVQE